MPDRNTYDYAVIRLVPRVERQEFINIGIILYCRALDYLDVIIDFDLHRLKYFAPDADTIMINEQLKGISMICSEAQDAGYFDRFSKSERFQWLVSPSSTIIQTSPVHNGISDNLTNTLKELYEFFVLPS